MRKLLLSILIMFAASSALADIPQGNTWKILDTTTGGYVFYLGDYNEYNDLIEVDTKLAQENPNDPDVECDQVVVHCSTNGQTIEDHFLKPGDKIVCTGHYMIDNQNWISIRPEDFKNGASGKFTPVPKTKA